MISAPAGVYEQHNDPDIVPNPIPLPFTLNKMKIWCEVSMVYANFDLYLKQITKVPMSGKELNKMINTDSFWEKRAIPNPYKVFIYSSNQLNDRNATRQSNICHQLQQCLYLESPLEDCNMNLFFE
jgi:hypothetical protein